MQVSGTDIECPCPMRHLQSQLRTLTYTSPHSDGANTNAKLFIHMQLFHNSLVASQKKLFLLHKVQVVWLTCTSNPRWQVAVGEHELIRTLDFEEQNFAVVINIAETLLGTFESFMKQTL